jgi:Flp pilus assembly pilin Flp
MTSVVQKDQSLLRSAAGATMASYAIVTGAIAIVCIGAITYLNSSTEKRVQELGDKAGATAKNKGGASLGGEVAKSTAIMGGVEMPFQFGLPLFALPYTSKKKDKAKDKDEGAETKDKVADPKDKVAENKDKDASCPGGQCGKDGSTCFVAGTLVLTPSGYRKIEDIRVGDEVLSVAEDSPWASSEAEAAGEAELLHDASDDMPMESPLDAADSALQSPVGGP